ncbi:MAG: hypothetical protein C0507_08015 [Cyanobacteria bacterium PR.3.49]|nr:hypothetical protein [Cyanobacteria bacterium PR.3.49]
MKIMNQRLQSNAFERRESGNTLALVAAIAAGILIFILLFALGYTRLVGSNQEQRTSVEAAALAAAKEASRIVINDPNFGYISLSDAAPVGKATVAGDNYFMPVNSINTLMGTIRLDLIIAVTLNNATMKELAKRDLANLKLAKENLSNDIRQALTGSGNSKDVDGNQVNPYTAAENAYKQNLVRMTGNSSYVNGSMKLTLGAISAPMQTNVPIPRPASYANVSDNQSMNGFYMSGQNIPFDGEDFVFAPIGASLKLVDPRKFTETLGSVPYQMPAVIKAEADHKIQDQADKTWRTVHAQTCASAASVYDPRPAPGTLTLSFPDVMPPEITTINTMLLMPGMNGSAPIEIKTAENGDYPEPGTSLVPTTWGGGGTANGQAVASGGFYDWIKRSGARLNADQAVKVLSEPLSNTAGLPSMHIFSVKPDGSIQYNYDPAIDTEPYWVASHKQLYAVNLDALKSTDGNIYDVHIRDYDYRPGTINGGKHGGEPLRNAKLIVPITMGHPQQMRFAVGSRRLELADSGQSGTMFGGDCGGSGDGATSWTWIGSPPPGPPTKLTIGGVNYKIWPNAGGAAMVRNDFGLPGGLPLLQFILGPGAGDRRPTYLQNGAVVDIRFRHAIEFPDPVGGALKKGYKTKKNDTTD